jgi:hypothetical protein
MRKVALLEREDVEWTHVMAYSRVRRMHSWSHSGLAMLVPRHVCGALLTLDEKTVRSKHRM